MNETSLQRKTLLLLLALVTIAFIWILLPFYGAIFWAVALGILFAPLQRKLLLKLKGRRNLATFATLAACTVIAIIPVIITTTLLVQEVATLYKDVESGKINVGSYVMQFKDILPPTAQDWLDRFGLGNIDGLSEKISKGALEGSQFFATQVFSFGQSTFDLVVSFFIMLYLLYFFIPRASKWCAPFATRCHWQNSKNACCNSSCAGWCGLRSRATWPWPLPRGRWAG